MLVSELLTQIRYLINDVDEVEYSDSELIEYINQAQDYVSNVLINTGSNLLLKSTDLVLTSGVATLPNDFVMEKAVIGNIGGANFIMRSVPSEQDVDEYTYKIIGNQIYSGLDSVKLYYFYMYPPYTSPTDEILIPSILINILREIVIFIALNRNEFNTTVEQKLIDVFERKILGIVSGIGKSSHDIDLPFYV